MMNKYALIGFVALTTSVPTVQAVDMTLTLDAEVEAACEVSSAQTIDFGDITASGATTTTFSLGTGSCNATSDWTVKSANAGEGLKTTNSGAGFENTIYYYGDLFVDGATEVAFNSSDTDGHAGHVDGATGSVEAFKGKAISLTIVPNSATATTHIGGTYSDVLTVDIAFN